LPLVKTNGNERGEIEICFDMVNDSKPQVIQPPLKKIVKNALETSLGDIFMQTPIMQVVKNPECPIFDQGNGKIK
jgi:hypothetical protein